MHRMNESSLVGRGLKKLEFPASVCSMNIIASNSADELHNANSMCMPGKLSPHAIIKTHREQHLLHSDPDLELMHHIFYEDFQHDARR